MNCYHVTICNPCEDSKGIDALYLELFTKLCKQLQLSPSYATEKLSSNELPSSIFKSCNNFFRLLLPRLPLGNCDSLCKNSESFSEENQWFNLCHSENHDILSETLSKEINNVNWNDLGNSEAIAGKLHNIADLFTNECYILNIFWLTCGHGECVQFSNNIPLYGALKRLQIWNNASITFICNTDSFCESKCSKSWFKELDISFVNFRRDVLIDNNAVWQGSLECLQYNENREGWRLSRTIPHNSVEPSELPEASSPHSRENEIPIDQKLFLADNIKIICELHQSAVPFWKLFPSQFILYHKSLVQRVLEIQKTSSLDAQREKETLLLASIATYDRKYQSQVRTTKDWIDFISSERSETHNDKEQTKSSAVTIKTFYFVLYPVEPGVFIAFFLRPEVSFISHHSLLYHATFPHAVKSMENSTLYEDCHERRWLQLLDAIQSSQKSPLKSQFSLAVHLDASEMLKHFTKDGKPLKKELKCILKQIEEKRKESPAKQKEIQKHGEPTAGVEYCLNNNSTTTVNPSPKLLPRHETLSICNTPNTLAKAKLQDVKRAKSDQTLSTDVTDDETQLAHDQTASTSSTDRKLEELEETTKKTKLRLKKHKKSSNEQINKESETSKVEENLTKEDKSRNKRISFDDNETVKATGTNAKEKRSDRHKRRLARVVKRSLIKYGVDPTQEYFTTCSERLYHLCKSFLKDLQTSEGLNNEMKRLADSNVATVVEFEKRRHASKASDTKPQNTLITNS